MKSNTPETSLTQTFVTALLLAGSASAAEAAVLESIRLLDRDEAPAEALFRRTVHAIVSTPHPEEREQAAAMLPDELKPVLRLSPNLRRCYVLRILAAMSSESCARLLHLQKSQVDDAACVAARLLAHFTEEEKVA